MNNPSHFETDRADPNNSALTDAECEELAGHVGKLNEIAERTSQAIEAKRAEESWESDREWWTEYRSLAKFKRRVRARIREATA